MKLRIPKTLTDCIAVIVDLSKLKAEVQMLRSKRAVYENEELKKEMEEFREWKQRI
jgi:hypothetical protein